MNISEWQQEVHKVAKEKGWYDKPRTIGDRLMLIVSEISEALEEYRKNEDLTYVYDTKHGPQGFPIELADAVIRILDLCEFYEINLTLAIIRKNAYNKTRPYRHGGKAI